MDEYDAGDTGMRAPGEYFYSLIDNHYNHLGWVSSASGNLQSISCYGVFGEFLSEKDFKSNDIHYAYRNRLDPSETNPTSEGHLNEDMPLVHIGFGGAMYDIDLQMYHMRNRWYDANIGRFIQRDPLGAFADPVNFGDPYAFVGNNPWSRHDPFGLMSDYQYYKNMYISFAEETVNDLIDLNTYTGFATMSEERWRVMPLAPLPRWCCLFAYRSSWYTFYDILKIPNICPSGILIYIFVIYPLPNNK